MGVHSLSMTHREAATFEDASTVPTPCLLLPALSENSQMSTHVPEFFCIGKLATTSIRVNPSSTITHNKPAMVSSSCKVILQGEY